MEKAKKAGGMASYNRIEKGPYILLIEVFIYWCAVTALVIATGIYLWHWDGEAEKNKCEAYDTKYTVIEGTVWNSYAYDEATDPNDIIDVQKRFSDILKIYFAYYIT